MNGPSIYDAGSDNMAINRSIQAGIRGCQKGSHCLGGCLGCHITRTKLLIHTGVVQTKTISSSHEDGTFTNCITIAGISTDSYLNELTEI